MRIKDIMYVPTTVSGNSPITKVRSLMTSAKVREVLVMDGDNLIGEISLDELMEVTSTKSNIECKGLAKRMRVTASPEDDSLDMAKQMVRAAERAVPVLDSNKLVGVVNSPCLLASFLRKGYKPIRKNISDVMNKPVTIDYQTELEKVWWKLKDFTGLPVMKKNSLVGIVTRADLISHGNARVGRESERHVKSTASVERVMTTNPITVSPSTKVEDAISVLLEKNFSMIPVLQDNKLVGVVSQFDLLGAYVR